MPRRVKLAVGIAALWVVSPIDLIPEFLPVIGPLDDIVVVALALRYAGTTHPTRGAGRGLARRTTAARTPGALRPQPFDKSFLRVSLPFTIGSGPLGGDNPACVRSGRSTLAVAHYLVVSDYAT